MRPVFATLMAASLAWAAAGQTIGASGQAVRCAQFVAASLNNAEPGGWRSWAPRAEIQPRTSVDPTGGRAGQGCLFIQTRQASDFGAWRASFKGLQGGRSYCFTAWYRTRNVSQERRSVIARLEWMDSRGQSLRPPDYAIDVLRRDGWTQVRYRTATPEKMTSVDVQLSLGFAADAAVWWDDVQLIDEPAPPDRIVRAATLFHRPRDSKSPADSVEQFCRLAEAAPDQKLDIVCLPEGITVVGTGRGYAEVSETIPGRTTDRLGVLARRLNAHVVAGLYERAGIVVYNTAVLLDRKGELIGKYRKTHLPREEWEQGITPGDQYPVFLTDFGKVGLMICWDLQFPEPARALAAQGAEIILLPIWGGSEVLARARAIENCVFLVSSSYDMKTFIVDPAGRVLAEADKAHPVAIAPLFLDRRIEQPWLGDMKTRAWKERRADLPVP